MEKHFHYISFTILSDLELNYIKLNSLESIYEYLFTILSLLNKSME